MHGADLRDWISDPDDDKIAQPDSRGRTLTARARIMLAVGRLQGLNPVGNDNVKLSLCVLSPLVIRSAMGTKRSPASPRDQ